MLFIPVLLGGLSMSDLNIFLKELDKMKELPAEEVEKIQRAGVIELQNRLLDKPPTGTPFDTGRARGSWGIDGNAPSSFELAEAPEGTQGLFFDTSAAIAQQEKLTRLKIGSIWYVYNNLPYISELNDGTSTQSPKEFVNHDVKIAEMKMQELADIVRFSL